MNPVEQYREELASCSERVRTYIMGLEAAAKQLDRLREYDSKLQEAVISAHGRALPENWVYQGPLESIDLLVAEILTVRKERETAEASEAQLARMAGEYERRFMAILGPELLKRREEQDAVHGGPAHDDCHIRMEWVAFIRQWATKASVWADEKADAKQFESRMFDIAGLAISAIQSTRRKRAPLPCDACFGDAGKQHTCGDTDCA